MSLKILCALLLCALASSEVAYGRVPGIKAGDIFYTAGYGGADGDGRARENTLIVVEGEGCKDIPMLFCAKYLHKDQSCAADHGSPVTVQEKTGPVLHGLVTRMDFGPLDKCSWEHTILYVSSTIGVQELLEEIKEKEALEDKQGKRTNNIAEL